jgi:prevent-host-death family protein
MVAVTTVPLAEVRANLAILVDAAHLQGSRITITRDGVPVAVLVGIADLELLEDALPVRVDPGASDRSGDANAAWHLGPDIDAGEVGGALRIRSQRQTRRCV